MVPLLCLFLLVMIVLLLLLLFSDEKRSSRVPGVHRVLPQETACEPRDRRKGERRHSPEVLHLQERERGPQAVHNREKVPRPGRPDPPTARGERRAEGKGRIASGGGG